MGSKITHKQCLKISENLKNTLRPLKNDLTTLLFAWEVIWEFCINFVIFSWFYCIIGLFQHACVSCA